jgi:multiple sugar transport system substrate-binding protein
MIGLVTRRAMLKGALAIAAAATTGAAGQVAQAAPRMKRAPLATVTIKVSVWPDVQDLGVYTNIIKDFQAAQNEIKVVPELFTGNYYAKVQTDMAAGTIPDIVYMQGWEWQPYAIAGALRSLDDFIKRDRAQLPNIWPAVYNPQTKWNGKTYMAPADTGPMVIFYNKAMFDKARVPYPKEGWTLDDFVQTAKELTVKQGSKVVQWGYQANYPDYIRNIGWMRLAGHYESSPLVKPKKATFDDPEITKYLQQQWYDMPKMGISLPRGAMLAGGGQNGNYFYGIQNGLVAMKYEGPWFMPQMTGPIATKKGGVPFDVVSMPKDKQWHAARLVHGHTISMQSQNPEAAWEFLKQVWSAQGQRRIADGGRTCNSPEAIQKIWIPIASKIYGFKNVEPWMKTMAGGEMTEVGGVNNSSIQVQGGYTAACDAISNGSQTADQAFATANVQIQGLYDAWWRAHPNG